MSRHVFYYWNFSVNFGEVWCRNVYSNASHTQKTPVAWKWNRWFDGKMPFPKWVSHRGNCNFSFVAKPHLQGGKQMGRFLFVDIWRHSLNKAKRKQLALDAWDTKAYSLLETVVSPVCSSAGNWSHEIITFNRFLLCMTRLKFTYIFSKRPSHKKMCII